MAGRGYKVFVGGLPQDCTDDILTDYFDKFGTITDVVVMKDRDTGRSRGFGFVSFEQIEAVDEIMSMHGDHRIQDKWIDCKRATEEGTKGAPSKGGGGKGGGGSGSKGGASDARPGDWTCHNCGANVFASKDTCFKCGARKPDSGGGAYGGGYGSYNSAPPPSSYGSYNSAPPPSSYGAAPPSYGAYAAYGGGGYGTAPPAYGQGGRGFAPY
eukprot:TRINITY_DN5205_c0_g1_i1.p1 TRINITY_DN5205_c0_g1~~TRINITY_DN5205_c0_g1_i1.p1  ORF type:complete len:241 (-),score=47.11 TRINITY_DN5205_c0_g1_i1:83-718(-)